MFNEAYDNYDNSKKEKTDIYRFFKETCRNIDELAGLKRYLEKSIVKSVVIEADGVYIILNDNFFNIKLRINEEDWEQLPIDILCMGNYEPNEFAVVKVMLDLLDDDDNITFFDIGANLGWYSLFICKMFKNSNVYAFEPASTTYRRLLQNMECNDASVSAYNVGFYKSDCVRKFYYDKHGSGASSLENIREKEDVVVESVKLTTIDGWVNKEDIKRVDVMKLDIEGAELFALEGGVKTIEKHRPIIFCEMLRKWATKFGYNPNDIIELLNNMGYSCYALGKYKPGIRICPKVDDNTEETNFFFFHDDKHREIIKELINNEDSPKNIGNTY